MAKKTEKLRVPQQLACLMEAMQCDKPEATRLLVERAMTATYPHKNWQDKPWNDQQLDAVVALIEGIKPRDTVESILAAQFVALHLQGTMNMGRENYNIMSSAMMMIRLSHQALDMLNKYRGKGQNINVTYNVLNKGNAILNNVVS